MRLTELKPCDICGEKIVPLFYRVSVERLMIDATAVNQTLGVNQIFGGDALRLAEMMSPSGDNVTTELSKHTLLICSDCFLQSSLAVALFEE